MPQIVAVVGLAGSGKSTVVNILQHITNAPVVYFGGVVISEVERRGLFVNETNERAVREELRSRLGMGAVAHLAASQIAALGTSEIVLIDGLYSGAETDALKADFPDRVVTVAVHAHRPIREGRVSHRSTRPLSARELLSRDLREVATLDKATPIALADYHLTNNSDEAALRRQASALATLLSEDG